MPEDSKKNQHKAKHDPKDQRKPRQGRHQAAADNKDKGNVEKRAEEPKVPPQKPVYEDPGPEFYKGLKRETDEILKITEEANSKYKKKEIQSNWTKYELPIESYEEIEEHENMGADYEKLIAAPSSIGGHFQFKHEKSWDISSGPSLYDKYFDINMDTLSMALSTIPFNERNNIEQSIFTQIDILTMDNRSTRYKQKYYNDKSFTTAELDAQDKILNSLRKSQNKTEDAREEHDAEKKRTVSESKDIFLEESKNVPKPNLSQNSENDNILAKTNYVPDLDESKEVGESKVARSLEESQKTIENIDKEETREAMQDKDIEETKKVTEIDAKEIKRKDSLEADNKIHLTKHKELDDIDDIILGNIGSEATSPALGEKKPEIEVKRVETAPENKDLPKASTVEKENNPVIESPEDLEKWLDDFLDG